MNRSLVSFSAILLCLDAFSATSSLDMRGVRSRLESFYQFKPGQTVTSRDQRAWLEEWKRVRAQLAQSEKFSRNCYQDPLCRNSVIRKRLVDGNDAFAIHFAVRMCAYSRHTERNRVTSQPQGAADVESCRKKFGAAAAARTFLDQQGQFLHDTRAVYNHSVKQDSVAQQRKDPPAARITIANEEPSRAASAVFGR
jgi:hypothetical protein